MTDANTADVVIVGGGPAGQAAAVVLAGCGASIVVVDEQLRPGGQILRQPPQEFSVRRWLPGRSYEPLKTQLRRFEALAGVRWLGGHSAIGISAERTAWTTTAVAQGGVREIESRAVLVASGCQDLAVPVAGWTLPGVMSAGGLQALIKSQQVLPGERIAFIGTHPLQLLVAAQIVSAGGSLAAVVFPQARRVLLRVLVREAGTAIRHLPAWWPGASALASLRHARVPVLFGSGPEAIEGTTRVERVRLANGRSFSCDTVALCYGFVPQSDLLRQAGAAMHSAGTQGGWAAGVDGWQETSIPGLYAAGETTGIAGAQRASIAGALAGFGIAQRLRRMTDTDAEHPARRLRAALPRLDRFAAWLAALGDPSAHWPPLSPDTIVCRCEDVASREIDAALETARSANALKAMTRCGMGICQGRSCEPTILRQLAARYAAADAGFTARFPARATMIGSLLSPR